MRKIILLFLIVSFKGFSQDPEIIGTWYLKAFMADVEPNTYLTSTDAPQNPTLIINTDYTFEGIGACNTFSGAFIYNVSEDVYYHENFVATNLQCETNGYNTFEDLYFSYFDDSWDEYLTIYRTFGGDELIAQVSSPGFGMIFQNTPFLGINDINKFEISISPNPATNTLFISSKNLKIDTISLFNLSGQKVLELENPNNSIDVSALQHGMYFLKMDSEQGNVLKKFVKN
ncbi:MAG: T9SS type A sorting domain-containing protein [Flavobacteriaceae bacterium]